MTEQLINLMQATAISVILEQTLDVENWTKEFIKLYKSMYELEK
jgi:hypothetical protein